MAQLFMPKNAIFGHFNPLPLIRISQKLSSHSKILIFTTQKILGKFPAKKIWRNFLCQKCYFLPFLPTFSGPNFTKTHQSLKYQYLLLLKILSKFPVPKKFGATFYAKKCYFWPFLPPFSGPNFTKTHQSLKTINIHHS